MRTYFGKPEWQAELSASLAGGEAKRHGDGGRETDTVGQVVRNRLQDRRGLYRSLRAGRHVFLSQSLSEFDKYIPQV